MRTSTLVIDVIIRAKENEGTSGKKITSFQVITHINDVIKVFFLRARKLEIYFHLNVVVGFFVYFLNGYFNGTTL